MTEQVVEATYDQFELEVFQAHLDLYRGAPESPGLAVFSVIHRGDREQACRRLEGRGMMNVVQVPDKNESGVHAKLTDNAVNEVSRLVTAGILKEKVF